MYPPIQAFEQRSVSARHLLVDEKNHPATEQCSASFISQTFLGDAEGKGALLQWLVFMFLCRHVDADSSRIPEAGYGSSGPMDLTLHLLDFTFRSSRLLHVVLFPLPAPSN